MKIALITDQHLDGRKGNLAFWNYFQKFYDEIFFPTLEKRGVKTIIDLGDTFDNRKSMDYNTFNRIDNHYFQRLKPYNVHMILAIIARITRTQTRSTHQNFSWRSMRTSEYTQNPQKF